MGDRTASLAINKQQRGQYFILKVIVFTFFFPKKSFKKKHNFSKRHESFHPRLGQKQKHSLSSDGKLSHQLSAPHSFLGRAN